jgi:hypothetical protein
LSRIAFGAVLASPGNEVPMLAPTTASPEILIGRALALCAHPHAAWRRSATSRLVVLFGYAAASYTVVLATLFALH